MSRRLHLALERVGYDYEPEMRLARGGGCHCGVVRVGGAVVCDVEMRWGEGCGELAANGVFHGCLGGRHGSADRVVDGLEVGAS